MASGSLALTRGRFGMVPMYDLTSRSTWGSGLRVWCFHR